MVRAGLELEFSDNSRRWVIPCRPKLSALILPSRDRDLAGDVVIVNLDLGNRSRNGTWEIGGSL